GHLADPESNAGRVPPCPPGRNRASWCTNCNGHAAGTSNDEWTDGPGAMITQVKGRLRSVAEESLILEVEPIFGIEVLIPEFARRQLQAKLGEPVTLHTVFDIE